MAVSDKPKNQFPIPFLAERPRPKIGDIVQRALLDERTRKPIINMRMVTGMDPDDGTGRWRAYVDDRQGQGSTTFTSDTRGGSAFELRLGEFVPADYEPFTMPNQNEPSHWCLKGHVWDADDGRFMAVKATVKA